MSELTGLEQHYRLSDRLMLKISVGLFLFALCLAPIYGTWLEAIIVGGATLGGLVALSMVVPGSTISRAGFGVGLMFFSALHIHQSNGMIEVHFGIFVLLAVLLVYRDWLPIIAAAAIIAVHHLSFYYFQLQGYGVWLLPEMVNGVWIVAVHATYVVVESALLVYLSIKQKREFLQADELMRLTGAIVSKEQLDLTIRSSGDSKLLAQFNDFTGAVARLANNVRGTAEELNRDGKELALSTQEMKDITGRQSSEAQQVSTGMRNLSDRINRVGGNAKEIASQVNEADKRAQEGAQVGESAQAEIRELATQVSSARDIIVALNERSEAISSVLDVIRTIADQTNLLALNAAIEAARAGEQGRGFAVVADEVRTLAQRTQDSTQEIDSMIDALQEGSESSVRAIQSSQQHVDACLEKTENSQKLMLQIREDVAGLMRLSRDIETQTEEQISAVTDINEWTEKLAAASEDAVRRSEAAASSGELIQKLALELTRETSRFKTG